MEKKPLKKVVQEAVFKKKTIVTATKQNKINKNAARRTLPKKVYQLSRRKQFLDLKTKKKLLYTTHIVSPWLYLHLMGLL